ncbi:malate synthase, glyoxysomal-like [Aricia agestis]|uniref:malate synthase, glyoxysomal-like n=1 Tax=Aricia agestis TaxID=91739 RepID=UPI001C20251F|nr:malate synthase, glyoxysomal-like [Aricia agestis]XP_041969865.1 malate synthase, glyoxysomal-like [Aricia agestis]XP_041969866.1 malate synthase, glyoxysomal-like [Aricia agestis]
MAKIELLQSPLPRLEEIQKKVFCKEATHFLWKLHTHFDSKIEQLTKTRLKTSVELQSALAFKETPEWKDKSWKVGPLPLRLQNRHLDLGDVSASNAAHFTAALNADVQGVQVDFDDGHCPTWKNQLLAYNNINLAVNGKLVGAPSNIATCPVLMLRPRAWNMIDHDILINGKEAIGPLVDFGILMYHNAKKLYEANSGPYFYLSKLEGASEAALWNEIFVWTQNELGLPQGSIKACVLIENILSTFEMEGILYVLKDHCMGLNCGIWDYCASIISKFGTHEQFLLPDRNKYVNMDKKFLKSYMSLVVKICHYRGALATGGMAAAMLKPGSNGQDEKSKEIVNNVLESKMKEINAGVDGFMVYDTRLVPYINELWKKSSSTPNQIHRIMEVEVTAQDLLTIPSGGVTLQGLKHNVAVTILFIYHWLAGIGHFFYTGNVEDSATAEISRAQIWQWIRFAVTLEDDQRQVTARLVEKIATNFAVYAHKNLCRSNAERKRLNAAKYMSLEIFLSRNPPEFITTYLNDNHKFRTLHNKALLSNL